MKSLTFLAFLAALLILSCTDTPIVPVKSDNQPVHLIKLPPKAGLFVEDVFSVTKTINGADGGTLTIRESYVAEDGHIVKIDVKYKIKKDSFSGEATITMTVCDNYAGVEFSPHMVFSTANDLDVKFEGLDLNALDSNYGDYDFIYIDDNGNVDVDIDYTTIQAQENQGIIFVENAKINHFSRYAFAR